MVRRRAGGARFWLAVVAVMALGLALRIAAAQGGLWLDEAWSAVYARDAGTPLAVLLRINHDNNHHLNTLWMLLVGPTAPPIACRALSIATGTAAIAIVAAIGVRRSAAAGLFTATAFAVSPLLVTYGAEARGYAPMLLCLLGAFALTDRALAETRAPRPVPLAILVLLGMFSQMTMAFGVAALAGWTALVLWHRRNSRTALRALVPLILPTIAVFAMVLLAARTSPYGFRMGSHTPYAVPAFLEAMRAMLQGVAGWLPGDAPSAVAGVTVLAALLVLVAPRDIRLPFWLLALFAFPTAVAVLALPNSGFPRYYMLVGVALLLVSADRLALLHRRAPPIALVLLGAYLVAALQMDGRLIASQRGHPEAAMAALQRLAPHGASIGYGSERSSAVVEILAARARYPLRPQDTECPAPDFLFVDMDGEAPFPARPTRCGSGYGPVVSGRNDGLSGMNWTLYARQP